MMICIQPDDFDVSEQIALLRRDNPAIGAVVAFVGLVRDLNDGSCVSSMTLEHYPGMTERALQQIVDQARSRWPLQAVTVSHRIGPLAPTEQIVLVAVATAHRGDAFQAAEFIMDYLKTRAPFWKKEVTPDGSRWVDARESDEAASGRWNGP